MRIEDVVLQDHELINIVGQYKPITESYQVLMEDIQDKVADAASRYNSDEPPESIILQDPQDSNLYVVFLSGNNQHIYLYFLNGKVTEEGTLSSFEDIRQAQKNLLDRGYRKIDTRSWYKRNWKLLLGAFAAGAVGISAGPLIAAELAYLATQIGTAAQFITGALGGGSIASVGQMAGGGALAVGFARLMDKIKK